MGNNKGNITLAIETAVAGGSLALLKDGNEIDLWLGGDGLSRSEDVVIGISELLVRNSLLRSELTAVAVSTGPGSYTGIRVGISTALGLKNALGIECFGIKILGAMAAALGSRDSISAIPVGRGEVCWQVFGPSGAGDMLVDKAEGLAAYLSENKSLKSILHDKVFRQIASHPGFNLAQTINAGEGLARYVGLAANSGREMVDDLLPTYVRDFV